MESFKDKSLKNNKSEWSNLTDKINEQFAETKKRINWFKVVYAEEESKEYFFKRDIFYFCMSGECSWRDEKFFRTGKSLQNGWKNNFVVGRERKRFLPLDISIR